MKQIKNYLFAGLAMLTISSCSKKNTDVLPPATPEIKKTITASTFNGNTSFQFGPDGKPKQFIQEKAWASYRHDFIYEPGKVTVDIYDMATNKKLENFQVTVNDKGLMIQSIYTQYDINGNPILSNTKSFSYTAKGLLETVTSPSSFSQKYFYDAEGNNTKSEFYNGGGQLVDYTEYSYSDKLDKYPAHSIRQFTWEGFFLPALSKRLVSHMKKMNAVTNAISFEYEMNYELDPAGYVKKGMVDDLDPAATDWNWTCTWDK
mgnify:CR=1 FL=1